MLRLALRREPRGIGGKKSKRRLEIPLVLGQVKRHTPHCPPGWIELVQIVPGAQSRRTHLLVYQAVELPPPLGKMVWA